MLRDIMYRVTLFLYRTFGAIMLYGLIGGIGMYAFTMGFYVVSSTWIAPSIVSPSTDKILNLTSQLISSQGVLNTVSLDNQKAFRSLGELRIQKKQLQALNDRLAGAISRETASNARDGDDLQTLVTQKRRDIRTSEEVVKQINTARETIRQDLDAGLITKGEAAIQIATLTQDDNTHTDNKIQEVLLRDSVKQKLTLDITKVSVLAQKEQLREQLAMVDIAIDLAEQQMYANQTQISQLERAIALAHLTPSYRASVATSRLVMAFVPYGNEAHAAKGEPVYECYLGMIICHEVGVVSFVFEDEEKSINPFLKTDSRGFIIQLELSKRKAAHSKTLFLGGKPLLI